MTSDSSAGDDGGGVVARHAVAPLVEQQRPVNPAVERFGDGLLGARVQWNFCRLVALGDDAKCWLVAGAAQIGDVGVRASEIRNPFKGFRLGGDHRTVGRTHHETVTAIFPPT